jgi:hypothetical protein
VRPRNRRLLARIAAAVVAVVALAVLGAVVISSVTRPPPPEPACHVALGDAIYRLDLEQAANAATIAAVGKREGLPDHAVTVALAAALQESQLHNLDYGDRDSIGLFQQRPSQGWGSRRQLLTPTYAAEAFYRELQKVSRWEQLEVTQAAQRVQRSAAPGAYATWEPQARALASALTGETPNALTCNLHATKVPANTAGAADAVRHELGADVSGPLATSTGWTAAAWLVAHADTLHLRSVGYGGMRWRASSGKWERDRTVPADRVVME